MNILYLSHLSGNLYAGPTHSVPKQICYQSQIDNVFWYNLVKKDVPKWKKLPYYYDLSDFPWGKIENLPIPFNKPDLIVIELFYNMVSSKLIWKLVQGDIPYVIIPRGELTSKAQKRKFFKKTIANLLICKRYAKKALGIQYLTDQEKEDSGLHWNRNSIVIPNGIEEVEKVKTVFSKEKIKCAFIGRIEPYQKGLDILIESCVQLKNKLKMKNCEISIYGPDVDNKLPELRKKVNELQLDNIIKFYGPVYEDEKKEILLEHDIFLMPSRFEGHPMALIEALSYGLPVVVSRGSNMKEEVEVNNAGWTSENSIESFTVALNKMLDEVNLFEVKGKNGIELANKYNWKNIAKISHEKYVNLLQAISFSKGV